MKTNRTPKIAAFATALVLAVSYAGSVLADGITAPPKTQELLNSYNRTAAITAPAEAQRMNCGMCRNEVTTRTDYTARGANKPAVTAVIIHACKMCDTQLKTVGVGKTAKTVLVHTCDHGCSVASAN